MTRMSTPILHVEGPTVLTAYEVDPATGDPRRRFHVTIRPDTYGADLVLFAGSLDDLHDLYLGLHNVVSDAGGSPDGRAEQVVGRPTEAVDVLDTLRAGGRDWQIAEGEGPSVD
jgi:hypothetical protein